jgi:hypothetical protein
MQDEELLHFGVKGMKWGIRKDKSIGKITSSDAKKANDAQALVKRHGTQALDNKDLQHLVTRMNLERQYNTIISQNPGKVKKGYGKAKEILGVAKTMQDAYNVATGPLGTAISKGIATSKKS